jgi:hypothetical protein
MSGIGLGPVLYSSNCVTTQSTIRYEFILPIVGSAFSLLATGIYTIYMGQHEAELRQIDSLVGNEMQLDILASLMANFHSRVGRILTFCIITVTGLNVLTLNLCMILNFLLSQFITLAEHRTYTISILTLFFFLLGILFCTERGLKILLIWEHYSIGLGPICLVAVEIMTFCVFSGYDNLNLAFQKLWRYGKFALLAVVIAAIVVIFISDCMNPLHLTATEHGLAWLLSVLPLTGFFVTFLVKKKQLLFCFKDQVVEGHMLALEDDQIIETD